MTTRTTNDDLSKRLREHPMHSISDLEYLRRKGYTDEQILAFWNRDHAAGKAPVIHAGTRIESIAIRVQSVNRQVHASHALDIEYGLSVYKTGCANVAVSDNYAPTYSFEPIDIDTTRRALAQRIFEKNVDDLDAGQHGELDAVIRACMLVANVTTI
ncbi:MAG: hypothetical protein IT430_19765 [Phycisphaerales bacterium]|nr:hypothetical protein [Phycisphaerales bacterium]